MKIVQTFWTGPVAANNPLAIKAGWLSAEYHWMSWALSSLQLHKLYGAVELVTDNRGKQILVDTLGLPYTSVSIALEGRLSGYAPELWSLAKIVAFGEQKEPFLHFDGDFFIWRPLDKKIMDAAIVAQNLEENLSYYRHMMQDMEKHGWRMPPILQGVSEAPIIYAANTGIFGGHDLGFVERYCQNAFEFINTNVDIIPKTEKNQLNFIFEQCLLYYLAQAAGTNIEYLIEEPVDEPSYSDYARFVDVPHVKMIHTLGGFKTMPYTCSSMAKRLRNDFPEHYYRIMALCGSMGVRNKIYHWAPFNATGFYPQLFHKGMQQYLTGSLQTMAPDAKTLLSEAHGAAFEAGFGRSCAVAKWLSQPIAETGGKAELSTTVVENYAALQQLIVCIDDAENRTCVDEIVELETRLFIMSAQLNDPVFLQHQYFKELAHYHKVEQLFVQPAPIILQAVVFADESVCALECSRDWNFSPVEATPDFLKEQLSETDSGVQILLKHEIENGEVAELYPDNMDMVVINTCKDEMTIADIVENIKQYFDADEIEHGYEAYQKLILDTIKQLLYNGLLKLQ